MFFFYVQILVGTRNLVLEFYTISCLNGMFIKIHTHMCVGMLPIQE